MMTGGSVNMDWECARDSAVANCDSSRPLVTVLGIGNTIFRDEGAGVLVLPLLEEALAELGGRVEIIEGATDGLRLLGPIEDTDRLVIVDAMNGGGRPGQIYRVERDDIPAYYGLKMSVHQLGFHEVLMAAKIRERLPERMAMFGVQPQSLEFGVGLSASVEAVLPELAGQVAALVREWVNEYEPA